MYSMLACFRKHPDVKSKDELIDLYENGEIPIVLDLGGYPPLYRRNYIVRPVGKHGSDAEEANSLPFDVVTQVEFDDAERARDWFAKGDVPQVESHWKRAFHPDQHIAFAYEVDVYDTSAGTAGAARILDQDGSE
ncbi:hypothetical protein [Sphingopyxis sp.]|uniref:hypothetical protein n=1 Tax=Sphingopyxis sp. TaxID=1908224 RepID=UPI002D786445|nr:hypothetical protein [Sphingopyxis sp.]HET6522868.1 hypothetical protein [Sphingopyxis sp.]